MKALTIFFLLSTSLNLQAQTRQEFFKQKKTQKKYLLEQIAALKIYANYLSKGYDIANKGLKTIKGFTKGEFDLHTEYFSSLKAINPAGADNKKVQDIQRWQAAITKAYNSNGVVGNLDNDERKYFESIKSKILDDCEDDIEEVLLVISPNKLEMKDEERLRRIDKLHLSMRDKFEFTESLIDKLKIFGLQKEQEKRNNQISKELHQLSN